MSSSLAEAFEEICVMDAPLSERLMAYNSRLKELSFPFAEAYDDLVSRLVEGEIGATAPQAGDAMPPFLLPGPGARLVSLEELLHEGPVVISFNRGHWCPFCKIELKSIVDYHAAITGLGARVVSILPDRQKFVGRLDADLRHNILFLSDMDCAYSLRMGIVLWLGDKLRELMAGRGHHLEDYQGADGWFVPLPATYVVAANGVITARHVDPDFRKRMDVGAIMAAIREANALKPVSL